jgi:hypothetical protein
LNKKDRDSKSKSSKNYDGIELLDSIEQLDSTIQSSLSNIGKSLRSGDEHAKSNGSSNNKGVPGIEQLDNKKTNNNLSNSNKVGSKQSEADLLKQN